MKKQPQDNSENKDKKRYYRRGYRRGGGGNRIEQTPQYFCPFCGERIRALKTAVARKEDNAPSHFDCVLKNLSDQEELNPGEKMCYLGNGSFGIIKEKVGSMSNRFFVRKRIQYENKETKIEWRRQLSDRVVHRNNL